MQTNLPITYRGLSIFVALLLLTAAGALAQSSLITGTVKGRNDETMPGVTVVLKGTTKGTTTDKDGTFAMEARKNQTLIFSYVGYQLEEVPINDQTALTVKLREASERLEEVVVTAENRSVSAQRVPITMDLVTGKNLVKQGVTDLVQLQNLAPGLNIVQNTVFNQINVRGIGSNDGAAELSDQAVTIGIDGEYLNRPVALNTSLFDLDRVEVLKGPQGTLYGRNATAGAVNIIAKKPTQTREIDLSATYGNYNTVKLQGAVNVPLGKIAAIRAAGVLSKHDGYRDGGPAGRIDNGNFRAGRLGISLNPTKALSVYVAGEISKTDQQAPSQYGVAMTSLTALKGQSPKNWTIDLPNDYPVATGGFMKVDQSAIRGRVAYDFGGAILTYTGGRRGVNMTGYQPLNGFVPETFSFHNDLSYRTQSHELRLNGESARFSWQVGGFYGQEHQDVRRGLVLVAAAGAFGGQPPFLNFFFRTINSTTAAVFGQATYNVSDKLGITLGIRNTTDKKTREGADLAAAPFGPPSVIRFFYPNVPTSMTQAGLKPLTGVPNEGRWNQNTWLVGLDYKVDATKMLFAKVSTGYKAGGFDNIGAYKPEYLTAFEVGTKNKFLDNRLRLNASAFRYDYQDQQVSVFISTAVGGAIQNAGKSTVNGVEVDGEYALTKADRLRFSINYLDAQFKDLPTIENVVGGDSRSVNLAGNRPIQAPKWTLTGGYTHDFTLGSGLLSASVQTLFKSDYYLSPFNYNMDKQAAYSKTDAYLTYTGKAGKWDVGVFVQNIEDNRIKTFAAFTGGTINIYNWIFGAPRLFGIQANLRL